MSILTWTLKEGEYVTIEHPHTGRQLEVKVDCGPYEMGDKLWIKYKSKMYIAYFSEQDQKWLSVF